MTDPRYARQHGPIGRPGDDPAAPRAAAATSLLFVPADRPERFDNAVAAGDLAILDLEAAVADPRKAAARDYVRAWLSAGGRAAVRVNVVESAEHERDLAALEGMPGLLAAVVPLAEYPDTLTSVAHRLGAPVIAMVESALGVHRAVELASAEGVPAGVRIDRLLPRHRRRGITRVPAARAVAARHRLPSSRRRGTRGHGDDRHLRRWAGP